MADDGRALEDAAAMVQALRADFDDRIQTMEARQHLRPTGTIEQTLRTTPAPGTLLFQGQTVNRADYPALWAFIVEQGLSPSMFGVGDGTTTFVLPDARGRFLINGGTLGPNTYAAGATGGAADVTLTSAQIPAHTHPATSSAGGHDHGGADSGAGGNHGNHNSGSATAASALAGSQDFFFNYATNIAVGNAGHSHGISTDGAHTHTVPANTGGGGAHENRPPFLAVGGLQIYT